MARVPDTHTFTLRDVCNIIGGGVSGLRACFANADNDLFDPAYEGNHDRKSNFRNYGSDDGTLFNDWICPPLTHLMLMYTNLHSGLDENNEAFSPVGDFGSNILWSSTESGGYGKVLNFGTGVSSDDVKTNQWQVRAFRAFLKSEAPALRSLGEAGGLIFSVYEYGGGLYWCLEASPDFLGSYTWDGALAACANLEITV
jgi:hypothetical protein